jgi:hypothetical protein
MSDAITEPLTSSEASSVWTWLYLCTVLSVGIALLAFGFYKARKSPPQLAFLTVLVLWIIIKFNLIFIFQGPNVDHALEAMDALEAQVSTVLAYLGFALFVLSGSLCIGVLVSSSRWPPHSPATVATAPETTITASLIRSDPEDVAPPADALPQSIAPQHGADTSKARIMAANALLWGFLTVWFASHIREPESDWFYGTMDVLQRIALREACVVIFVIGLVYVLRRVSLVCLWVYTRLRGDQGSQSQAGAVQMGDAVFDGEEHSDIDMEKGQAAREAGVFTEEKP